MKIGIVLSKTPEYSETFFISKIKGLKASGFDVILFAQHEEIHFDLCKLVLLPSLKSYPKYIQVFKVLYVFFGLILRFPVRFFSFVKLEMSVKRSWFQIFKNVYSNSHLLKSNVNWLHFGFATLAIQSEHVAQSIGAKMAVSFRGYDLNVYPKEHPNCYKLLWEKVDKIHAISKYMLSKGYKLGLQKQKPFNIITPAIDLNRFKAPNFRDWNSFTFITIARLHEIKGLIPTLKAMALLKKKGVKFSYHIIGEGPQRKDLTEFIKTTGLNKNVFLQGKVNHNLIINLLNKANYYIQYSHSEGFCNAVLEAQAMGLFCMVSDGGALPENVIHKQSGWVVQKNSPDKLLGAILKVLNLPDDKKLEITNNAIKRVKNDFNLKKQQQKFEAFYK